LSEPTENPRVIHHAALGRLEVLDDSDPAVLTVRNELGNTLRIGKAAVGLPTPGQAARAVEVLPPQDGATGGTRPGGRPATSRRAAPTYKAAPRPGPTRPAPGAQSTIGRYTMEPKVIEFTVERETKNTVRYEEQTDGQPPAVGTLYVQKWALGSPVPPTLKVTIEAGK